MGNTEVTINNEITTLRLHGNRIAYCIKGSKNFVISSGGWMTATIKERLNALPDVSIYQKNRVWFLNGCEWDGNNFEVEL
jgi:isocitrate lyase